MKSIEKIEMLSGMLYSAERNKKIAGWASVTFLVVSIGDVIFRYLYQSSALFEGIIVGCAIGCWGMSLEHASEIKRMLDKHCYQEFGKDFESSVDKIAEIRDENYKRSLI
ncbi:hypothetical protein [Raoultella sp. HC6]|uniref:hypothetical protein n=1 Tax=Raoultella sp. HC6 TaxID=2923366 RepID=UPI001F50EB2A|nr:hypothetical protein [Raoultella sp. HC6]